MIWLALVLIRYMPENPVSPETIYIAGPGKDAGGLTKLSHKDNLRMKYSLILMLSPPGLFRTDRSGGRGGTPLVSVKMHLSCISYLHSHKCQESLGN